MISRFYQVSESETKDTKRSDPRKTRSTRRHDTDVRFFGKLLWILPLRCMVCNLDESRSLWMVVISGKIIRKRSTYKIFRFHLHKDETKCEDQPRGTERDILGVTSVLFETFEVYW